MQLSQTRLFNGIGWKPRSKEVFLATAISLTSLPSVAGASVTWFQDMDEDGFGDPLVTQVADSQPIGFVSDDNDCDDTDVTINPGADEIEDQVDNNCDGIIDEGFAPFSSTELIVTATPNPIPQAGDPVTLQIITRNNGNTAGGVVDVTVNGFLSVAGNPGSNCVFPQALASGQSYICSWTATFTPGIYDFIANDDVTFQLNLQNGDFTGPTTTITGAPVNPVSRTPFDIEIRFSEAIRNFDLNDIVVGNGTASNLQIAESDAQWRPVAYSARITPDPTGTVTIDVPAGVATDGANNDNNAATQVVVQYDTVSPTVAITGTPAQLTDTSPFNATIEFSENVNDFFQADVAVGNGSVTGFSGSGDTYTVQIAPDGSGDVTIDVAAAVAQDDAGNDNTAASQIIVGFDDVAPGLVISGVPGTFEAGDVFNVSFDFGESVSGFIAGDVVITGAVGAALTGGPQIYAMTVTPDGSGNVTISVPEGAAQDGFGNFSAAASATATIDSAAVAGEMIADFMQTRARNLVQNQPGLTGFMTGRQTGQFNLDATGGAAKMNTHSGRNGPIWFALQGSRTDFDNRPGDSTYLLGTIGTHARLSEGLMLGGMVQFDYADDDMGGGVRTKGQGWLAGPYVIAQLGEQPVFFEGRVLYGRSDNDISPFGTFEDQFDSTRWLTTLAVEGSYQVERVKYFPRLQFSHVSDTQEAYVDGLANPIPEQRVRLTELSAGVDFEKPLMMGAGDHMLTWGVSGIYSRLDGNAAASSFITETEGGRARLDLGYLFNSGDGLTATADVFVDGVGSGDFVTYGVSFGMAFQF